jgi:hypothetical protein
LGRDNNLAGKFREGTEEFQVPFVREKSKREHHFVVHLERNVLRRVAPLRKRNERMWANEIHVQVPKHSWQFPRVIGS